ncbi:peptidase T [Treponema lecithinolyticum]|uniref:peptidase T n=1 Tax=Treponema lecithinolyticum TaxID=53418 RepID=UPI0028EF5C6E|nr:peptidase T [Treponema lecithinolyticum]
MKNYDNAIAQSLLQRFLRYVQVWTTSDETQADKGIIPSTERQWDLARILEKELHDLGIEDVHISANAYVCARIPASKGCEKAPSVGFLAHMDTAGEVTGKNVKPQIVKNYDGSVLYLKEGIVLDPAEDEALEHARGETIITTDGTTLLGSDDKAGIASIMTALDTVLNIQKKPHGQIEIIFSPDEETGHGMDKVPLDWIRSKQCYTIDGGHIGEVESECFTAWKSEITFTGKAKHTGTARPDMVNAVTMASAFVIMLPQNESPEATDGYLGFYAPMQISGHMEKAEVLLFLRDYTDEAMERRKKTVTALAKAIEYKFSGGSVKVKHSKQYVNMKKRMDEHPEVMSVLVQAVRNAGIEPVSRPIRGGTDGSRLTEMGIPTPNIFTGGHNFHSRREWASLNQMSYAVGVIIELIDLWGKRR